MIILGVDPGLAITGWGVIIETAQGICTVRAHGAVHTPASEAVPRRLKTIYEQVQKLLQLHRPDIVAVEQLFFMHNTSSRLSVGQARGVVLLAAELHNIPIKEYAPKVVKLAVTGYGSAGKSQIAHMIQTILRLPAIPTPDDVTDALAIAVCHAQSYRMDRIAAAGRVI
jgi:crossover junction endodeoxyribonuclease RuvC